ncbi:MAG: ImmA/IrrE family metallo-endopeptidase [Neobacillus sp.]
MALYIANPISRSNIRALTGMLRKVVDLDEESYFPVMGFLELVIPQIDPAFEYEIVPVNHMKEYGITYPEKNKIRLREDVYDNAISGIARDRFTVAHEIGHYFLHKPGSISLARSQNVEINRIPAYQQPEWQANTFAGELLAPPHIIKGLSIKEIAIRCGVSLEAAGIQLKNMHR